MDNKTMFKALRMVLNNNTVLPVLEMALLQPGRIAATDLEVYLEMPFLYEGESVAVRPADLEVITGSMQEPVYSLKGDAFIATEGDASMIVDSEKSGEFPKSPMDGEVFTPVGVIRKRTLAAMVEALPFVGRDDLRPAMTMLYVHDRVVATDTHRLFYRDITPLSEHVLFPTKVVKIMALLPEGAWVVEKRTEDGAYYRLGHPSGMVISFRKTDYKFPDYKVVLPDSKPNIIITFGQQHIISELKKAMRFSNMSTNQVNFVVKGGEVFIKAADVNFTREYNNKLEAHVTANTDMEVAANGRFLLQIAEAVKKQKKDLVTLQIISPTKAIVVNGTQLVMPLMLN